MKYFLVGIKGTGMSALALYLNDIGEDVEGSDVKEYFFTEEELKMRKINIYNFSEDNITGRATYIISHAYEENIETKKIIDNEYRYYYYNEFISLLKDKELIVISGTHGKTTTSYLLKYLLKDLNPSYIIGSGEGYGNIKSNELIIEGCEYKEHFLAYNPKVLIINNIELDHLDYYNNIKEVINAFQKLADKSKIVILNGDDKNSLKIKHQHKYTFGYNHYNDFIISKCMDENQYNITVKNDTYHIYIPFKTKEMIYNFLSCFALIYLKYPNLLHKIDLKLFKYPKRRNNKYIYNNVIIYDDYAHHPTELRVIYNTIKNEYPNYHINLIYEPHTYLRTIKLKKEFKKIFNLINHENTLYIHPTYIPKREKENQKLRKKSNKILKKYPIFKDNIIDEIIEKINSNQDQKIIYAFIGAGIISDNIIKIIANEKNYENK